jgi:hypothetical protein
MPRDDAIIFGDLIGKLDVVRAASPSPWAANFCPTAALLWP